MPIRKAAGLRMVSREFLAQVIGVPKGVGHTHRHPIRVTPEHASERALALNYMQRAEATPLRREIMLAHLRGKPTTVAQGNLDKEVDLILVNREQVLLTDQ